jgi:hypothetical protein
LLPKPAAQKQHTNKYALFGYAQRSDRLPTANFDRFGRIWHKSGPFNHPNGRHISMGDFAQFDDVCRRVESSATTPDDAIQAIKSIDFIQFDIDQIQRVQDAQWLPDEIAVDIMKRWIRRQDEILLKLRAYLVVTPTITKDELLGFTQTVRNPSREPNLIVTDVFRRLATAGETREPVNPLVEKLITASASSELPDHKLADLFSFNPEKFFVTQSTGSQWFIVSLPPFLKIQVTAYKLKAPPKESSKRAQGGISSWHLQASDDIKTFSVTVDLQTENKVLQAGGSEGVFQVPRENNIGFYRHFKLDHRGANHQGNNSILLAGFDLTGELIICRE